MATIKQKIKANRNKIASLDKKIIQTENEYVDLLLEFYKANKTYSEKEQIVGRGKNKKRITVGKILTKQSFTDEDTGEVVVVEVNETVIIDGKPKDDFGQFINKFKI